MFLHDRLCVCFLCFNLKLAVGVQKRPQDTPPKEVQRLPCVGTRDRLRALCGTLPNGKHVLFPAGCPSLMRIPLPPYILLAGQRKQA